jgi:ribosomal protein L37E
MGELIYFGSRKREVPEMIECLACGSHRFASDHRFGRADECSTCGYVGWAALPQLSDADRQGLHQQLKARTRPVATIGLRGV